MNSTEARLYSARHDAKSMNVGQLIEALKAFPPDALVIHSGIEENVPLGTLMLTVKDDCYHPSLVTMDAETDVQAFTGPVLTLS